MNQGTKWALMVQKNRHRKSHAWAPLSSAETTGNTHAKLKTGK
jgi:hypothetical protein